MTAQARPDAVLLELLAGLDQAAVPAALLGGYAVVTWGVPRATYDVDLLVEADEDALRRCLETLEQRGFGVDEADKRGWRDAIRDMPLVKVQRFRDGRAIANDLFPVTTPLQQSAFARCTKVRIPGRDRDVAVISAADLVLFKLLADRAKDRADVQNILMVQGVPEPEYLREWAARVGVAERLERALAEAGLGPQP